MNGCDFDNITKFDNIANNRLLLILTYMLMQWFYINIHTYINTYMPGYIRIYSYLAWMANGETECCHKQL